MAGCLEPPSGGGRVCADIVAARRKCHHHRLQGRCEHQTHKVIPVIGFCVVKSRMQWLQLVVSQPRHQHPASCQESAALSVDPRGKCGDRSWVQLHSPGVLSRKGSTSDPLTQSNAWSLWSPFEGVGRRWVLPHMPASGVVVSSEAADDVRLLCYVEVVDNEALNNKLFDKSRQAISADASTRSAGSPVKT